MTSQTKEQGMSLLKMALEARIPLVGIHTEDVMYLADLFEGVLGYKPKKLLLNKDVKEQISNDVFYLTETSSEKLYGMLVTYHQMLEKAGASLILVNMKKSHPTIFDVGLVAPPKPVIEELLFKATGNKDAAHAIMNQTGSMGIKQVTTAAGLTMARDKSITVDGMARTRKQMFQSPKGVVQLSLDQQFYIPNPNVEAFAKKEKMFFLEAEDRRLRPRGILMDGPPGTGKTESVKWLARQWGVSAFRLDIASVQDKYVGESQRFLANALQQIEAEAPCILLVDEVEKVMSSKTNDSSGTKRDMLSQLLWWLQEHSHRVLTVMTTNDKSAIPPEMIRPGRIDKHVFIGGLKMEEAAEFLGKMLATFEVSFETGDEEAEFIDAVVAKAFEDVDTEEASAAVAHATITNRAIEALKNYFNPSELKGA